MTNRDDRWGAAHWDDRYRGEGYLFGTDPDRLLVEVVNGLPVGRALSLGDGEGRNGVWLAERGFDVTTIDLSAVAVAKARALAASRGVAIDARVGSLADHDWWPDSYDLVVSLFVHPPAVVRAAVHRGVVRALRPGGTYVAAGHTPEQVRRGGRGPREEGQALTEAALRAELEGLDIVRAAEVERPGRSAEGPSRHVLELVARRTAREVGPVAWNSPADTTRRR